MLPSGIEDIKTAWAVDRLNVIEKLHTDSEGGLSSAESARRLDIAEPNKTCWIVPVRKVLEVTMYSWQDWTIVITASFISLILIQLSKKMNWVI